MRRCLIAALLGVLVLGAGGCGGSSRGARKGASGPLSTQSTATSTITSSGSASAATSAPPPTPAGTPAPPDGLRPSTGYATYEMCSSGCSGAVGGALRRPLPFPSLAAGTACVSHQVNGPVKPLGAGDLAVKPFVGSAWEGARVTWSAGSSYEGPVLIRGRRIDGPGAGAGGGDAVGFGEGHVPYDELQLNAPGQGAATPRGTGREWFTFTRVRRPGCYFYQVDGTGFTETILFMAVG